MPAPFWNYESMLLLPVIWKLCSTVGCATLNAIQAAQTTFWPNLINFKPLLLLFNNKHNKGLKQLILRIKWHKNEDFENKIININARYQRSWWRWRWWWLYASFLNHCSSQDSLIYCFIAGGLNLWILVTKIIYGYSFTFPRRRPVNLMPTNPEAGEPAADASAKNKVQTHFRFCKVQWFICSKK